MMSSVEPFSDPLIEWNLTVGEIVAPFGLTGEMKVRLETDFPERFTRLRQLCVRWSAGRARLFEVEATRPHKGQILLRLREVVSIEEAEQLRNTFVQVRARDAVPLPDNEYYIYDLIGCEVVIATSNRKRSVATATENHTENNLDAVNGIAPPRNPEIGEEGSPNSLSHAESSETFSVSEASDAHRTLGRITSVLRGGANDVYVIGSGKDEILLPAVKDVIRHVDLQQRRIVVTPTPGLLPGEAEEA